MHKFLYNELDSHRIVGPSDPSQLQQVHISRFRVMQKSAKSRKCLTIHQRYGTVLQFGVKIFSSVAGVDLNALEVRYPSMISSLQGYHTLTSARKV